MTWSWLDCLIIALAICHIGALAAIVVTVLRIKSGPVDGLIAGGKSVADRGQGLFLAGKGVFDTNRHRLVALASEASGLTSAVRGGPGRNPFQSEAINYVKMMGLLATARKIRGGLALAGALRRGGIKGAISHGRPKTPSKKQRSLADRLGLLPPVAVKIAPILRFAKTALGVHRQLRKRGLL